MQSINNFLSFCACLVAKNQQLLNVCKDLHGLGNLDILEVNDGKGGSDIQLLLVADDPMCCGTAVYWDKGAFHVVQMLRPEEDLLAYVTKSESLEEAETAISNYSPKSSCKEIYTETNQKKLLSSLRFFWDHYNCGDGQTFCFPLSNKAYATSKEPYSKLRVRTMYGPRELDETEKRNFKSLQKKFLY